AGDPAARWRRRGGHHEPVVGVARGGAHAPIGGQAAADLGDAGPTRRPRKLGEAAVARHTETCADALAVATVDDDAAAAGVDDAQLGGRRRAHRAPEALDRDLE